MEEPYEKSAEHKEHLIFQTPSGNVVRSKSEVMIETALFNHGISFRYEEILRLKRKVLYPDFTILRPKTMEILYWEHNGMMNDENYINIACAKLKTYCSNGIYPNQNLIITYETKDNPLSPMEIERIIKEFIMEKVNQEHVWQY